MPLQCWHGTKRQRKPGGNRLPHQSMHGILPRPTPYTHFDCSPQQAALCSRAHGRRCGPGSLAYAMPGAPEQLPPLPATRHRCWLMSSLGQSWSSFSLAEFQLCCRHAKQPLPAQAETRSDLGKPARACHVVPSGRPQRRLAAVCYYCSHACSHRAPSRIDAGANPARLFPQDCRLVLQGGAAHLSWVLGAVQRWPMDGCRPGRRPLELFTRHSAAAEGRRSWQCLCGRRRAAEAQGEHGRVQWSVTGAGDLIERGGQRGKRGGPAMVWATRIEVRSRFLEMHQVA